MRFLPLLLVVLTGCSQPAVEVESLLNSYAIAAANQADLSEHLAGSALIAAEQSAELITELGLRSFGSSRFSETTRLSDSRYRSCLDVSATSFRDANDQPLLLERLERQLVIISVTEGKISNLELEGTPC